MSKRSKNLSLDDGVLSLGQQIIELRRFPNLSACVEQLIREEHERRFGLAAFKEQPNPLSNQVEQQVVKIVADEVAKQLASYSKRGKSSK